VAGWRYRLVMALIPADAAVRSARGMRWALGAITLGVLAADQVSKSLVLAAHTYAAGHGWVSLRLLYNTGASGGLASGYPVLVTLAAFAVTAAAATFALRARGRAAALCLAAVLGGALGNLSDRLFRGAGWGRGGVVDWIHLASRGGSMDVADIAIQLGVLGAVIALVVGDRARRPHLTGEIQPGSKAQPATDAKQTSPASPTESS
jgi:signal peptidase II